ncbi:tetratricopeptide repeat protein [Ferrimonas balearica]|uniref:tetratricopeptide repeat protein n=1 Tax=Ferrimonas balearica TaxID=44012 RepID=UPI001C995CCA|nr:tetratricopeptide repeat protein [Ferrimonas balearica]MBY5992764.1 tetratricopeptide repeat protein [Ferrimonas balearica]
MRRFGLVLAVWMLVAKAQAFGPSDPQRGWSMVEQDPERILALYLDESGQTPELESERLLLLGYAYKEQSDKPGLQRTLTQLQHRTLTATQQARFLILEGLYIGPMESRFDEALSRFESAQVRLASRQDPTSLSLQIHALTLSGSLLRYLDRIPEAIDRLGQARQRAVALGDKAQLAQVEQHLGRALRMGEQPRLAAEHYRAALNLSEHVVDPKFPGTLELELARLYRGVGEHPKTLEHAHNAAHLLEQAGEPLLMADALAELGYAYRALDNTPRSLHYYMLALDHQLAAESVLGVARTRRQIALTYLAAGEPEKSLDYLHLALEAFRQRNRDNLVLATRIAISETFLALGRWSEAQRLAEELLVQSRQAEDRESERALLLVMAKANRALARTEQAWEQLMQVVTLPSRDLRTASNLGAANQLAEQQLRNQLQRQVDELNQAQVAMADLRNQRLLTALVLIALVLSLLLMWRRQRSKGGALAELHHQAHYHTETGAGNRLGLFRQLDLAQPGYLVLLKVGALPDSEIASGQTQFADNRQRLVALMSRQGWVESVYEPSLGLVALVASEQATLESELLRLFDTLEQTFGDRPHCQGPHSAGVIPLPFQPGALLRLPPEQALELTQLALWSANDLAQRTDRSQFVQLRPVALSAPLLNPDNLYASAIKGIQHGVIRCLVSDDQQDLRWPLQDDADAMADDTENVPSVSLGSQ